MRYPIFSISRWKYIPLWWRGAALLALASLTLAADATADDPEYSRVVQQLTRGAYLTRIGNCMGCHTAKGGQPYAGGRRLATSFGIFVTPNITPDKDSGVKKISGRHCMRVSRATDSFFILLFPIPNTPK